MLSIKRMPVSTKINVDKLTISNTKFRLGVMVTLSTIGHYTNFTQFPNILLKYRHFFSNRVLVVFRRAR